MMYGWKKRYDAPKNCDELVDLLISELASEHQETLARMTEAEFERFYGEVAVHIVDEFDLWTGNQRLLNSCLLADSSDQRVTDPGRVIVEKIRDRVQNASGRLVIT